MTHTATHTATAVLAGIALLVFSIALLGADSSLPEAVPDDFPFPEEASLRVQDGTSASMIQIAVAFSFESDPASIYSTFRGYVVENGYEISSEDESAHSFSSTDYGSGDSIGLRISEMGSVNIATVTFVGPNR